MEDRISVLTNQWEIKKLSHTRTKPKGECNLMCAMQILCAGVLLQCMYRKLPPFTCKHNFLVVCVCVCVCGRKLCLQWQKRRIILCGVSYAPGPQYSVCRVAMPVVSTSQNKWHTLLNWSIITTRNHQEAYTLYHTIIMSYYYAKAFCAYSL